LKDLRSRKEFDFSDTTEIRRFPGPVWQWIEEME
jgi:hypothetical protein